MSHSTSALNRPSRRRGFRPDFDACERRNLLSAVPNTSAIVTYNPASETETIAITNTGTQKVQFVVADYTFQLSPNFPNDFPPYNQTLHDWHVVNVKPGETETVTLNLECGFINQTDIFSKLNPGGQWEGTPSELEREHPNLYTTDPDIGFTPTTWNTPHNYAAFVDLRGVPCPCDQGHSKP